MSNAAWLALALPQWYFATILAPFSAGSLTAVPALGVACLVVGSALGIRARAPSLLYFALLALASEIYVAVAGLLRGVVDSGNGPIFWAFLAAQALVAAYLIYRLEGVSVAAALLSVFTTTYAAFASFVAAMSFSDTW